jgi:mono/diheme cytochrome c family protein
MIKAILTTTAAVIALSTLNVSSQTPEGKVDFEKQVLPIFKERCFECHQKEYTDENGRVKKPKGKFRMDNPQLMLKGGSSEGDDVVPGDSAKSAVYVTTTMSEDEDEAMPPKGERLTKEQQDLIKKWIDEGANFGAWTGTPE